MTGSSPGRWEWLAGSVIVVGGAYLVAGPPVLRGPSPEPVPPPDLVVERLPGGREVARVDYVAWRDACRRADLPDPPALDGTEPETVRVLFDTFRRWARSRDVGALGRLGQIYQGYENHKPALECFAAAHRIDPDDGLWAYHLGAECQVLGLLDGAIEFLEEARRLDPGYPTTYARLGRLYLERGELDLARARYEGCLERHPVASLGYVGLGRVALARGDLDRAEALFREAVRTTPRDFLAHRLLAQVHASAGRPELARRHGDIAKTLPVYTGWLIFDDRLRESRRITNTFGHLEQVLREALTGYATDLARAPGLCEQLIARRPGDHGLRATLARIRVRLAKQALARGAADQATEHLAGADEAIDGALALKPDSAPAHYVRATIAFTRDDYPAVLRALDEVFALEPDHAGAVSLRARTEYLEGRREDGIETMRRAKTLDPTNLSTRLTLAVFLMQTGKVGEAVAELKELIRVSPHSLEAARASVLLERIEGGDQEKEKPPG